MHNLITKNPCWGSLSSSKRALLRTIIVHWFLGAWKNTFQRWCRQNDTPSLAISFQNMSPWVMVIVPFRCPTCFDVCINLLLTKKVNHERQKNSIHNEHIKAKIRINTFVIVSPPPPLSCLPSLSSTSITLSFDCSLVLSWGPSQCGRFVFLLSTYGGLGCCLLLALLSLASCENGKVLVHLVDDNDMDIIF